MPETSVAPFEAVRARKAPMTDLRDADVAALMAQQVAYYRARAGEYDLDMWQRDSDDPELRAGLAAADAWFETVPVRGHVLELACGTGAWTGRLAERAETVLALDAAPEMIARAQRKVAAASNVAFKVADVFRWMPPRRFDAVFFSFLLSHIPPPLTARFWQLVTRAVSRTGTIALIDASPDRAAEEQWVADGVARRHLRDGSAHHVVKVFTSADQLTRSLAEYGLQGGVQVLADRFVVATATSPRAV